MKIRPSLMLSITLLAFLTTSLAALGNSHDGSLPTDVPKGVSSSDWSGIRAAYEAGRHAAHRENDGTLAARNPRQQWLT